MMAHHFQRHHLITKFVAPESNAIVRATVGAVQLLTPGLDPEG